MRCPQCQHENRAAAKFCDECGHALRATAPSAPGLAAAPAPAGYTPKHLAEKILTSRSALEGERKQVTVVFVDCVGFTAMSSGLDPEDLHGMMDGCFQRLLDAVHRYEGTVNQFTGDGIMALFGAPISHEDHAVRAVAAALAMQRAVREYAEICGASAASSWRCASASTPGRSSWARSATTCAWTTPPRARR